MVERYDVIVVGSGPAGSAAATALARGGARVLALDRARFPRDKACGDTLTPKAFPALERLGCLDAVLDAGASASHYVWRSPSGREIRLDLPAPDTGDVRRGLPLSLPRHTLDALLRDGATAAGAIAREGHRVRGVLRGAEGRVCGVYGERWPARTTFEARADVVLAADGALSPLVRAAVGAPPARTAWGARVRLEGVTRPPDGLLFWFDRRLIPGYAWLFPLPDGTINAGIGVAPVRYRGFERGVRGLFDAVVGPELRRRFPGARVASPLRAGPISTLPTPRALPPGLLAIGDAAGLVDPFSGEGIATALASGLAAADAVLLRGPSRWVPLAADYGAAVRLLRADRRLSQALLALARSPWLLERGMDVARLRPALAAFCVTTLARRRPRDLFGLGALRALLE